MPLSRANPPLTGSRGRPRTRRTWPQPRMIVPNAGARNYDDRVLNSSPVIYFPMLETSGTVCACLTDSDMNGTYARDVALMGTGAGPDGRTAPLFNGTSDLVSFGAGALAALDAVFDGAENSLMIWARVSGAGVWTDSTERVAARMYASDNNLVDFLKASADNWLQWRRIGNAVWNVRTNEATTITTWMCLLITISETADEVRAYLNGTQYGAALTGLGAWAGALGALGTCIGAGSTGPSALWDGWLGRYAAWDRALTPTEAADLYMI